MKWLVVFFTLASCGDPTWLDNGLMVRDGVELHQEQFPIYVYPDGEFDHPSLVNDVIDEFNDIVGETIFVVGDSSSEIVVYQGLVPSDYEESTYDLTMLDYDLDTGNITQCEIILSSDFAYDYDTMHQTLLHSLGHSLGLDDDPGPPETIDLRSVMSKPLDPLGRFTEHDLDIIHAMYDEYMN